MPTIPKEISDRLDALLNKRERAILGLAGPPGCGKSSLAGYLEELIGAHAVVLPMDGYHLANDILDALGRRNRKGAPDTFDSVGFAHIVGRAARRADGDVVYAPAFDREIDAAIAGAIAIPPSCRLLIVEGNYLLCDGVWQEARSHMDSVWYLGVNDEARRKWLAQRHVMFGRTQAEALDWIDQTDEPNARLIASCRDRADWIMPDNLLLSLYQ